MWLPLFPWGSNIASSKPVNLRRESILCTVPPSSPWWSRGMSSLCRIMIFFHVRTFTLWNEKKRSLENNKPCTSASFRLQLQLLKITTHTHYTWTRTPRRQIEDPPHTQSQASRACWILTGPAPWTTPRCFSSSPCCRCGDCKSTVGWRLPAAARRQTLSWAPLRLICFY